LAVGQTGLGRPVCKQLIRCIFGMQRIETIRCKKYCTMNMQKTEEKVAMDAKKDTISFSLFQKKTGILTKRVKLVDGKLVKDASECKMSTGGVATIDISPEKFPQFLQAMTPNRAIAHGICGHKNALIVSKAKENGAKSKTGLPVIARSKKHFRYPEAPGLMMFDHDRARDNAIAEEEKALQECSPERLIEIVSGFFPEIGHAAHVSACSTSSCIYNKETGEELRGKGAGFHLYLFPRNASDVPRFLDVLGKRLFLAGYGRMEISRAGTLLPRTLVDLLVGSPERLDFVAGAVCDKGLEQRRPAPEWHAGELLDTEKLLDPTAEEKVEHQETVSRLQALAQPALETVKAAYVEQEAAKLASGSGGKISLEQARATVKARQNHVLADADLLHFEHRKEPVSVAHVLDNGLEFNDKSCADPLEPEYNGGSRSTAKFYWNNGEGPVVLSYAHGGMKYTFKRSGTANVQRSKAKKIDNQEDYVDGLLAAIEHGGCGMPTDEWNMTPSPPAPVNAQSARGQRKRKAVGRSASSASLSSRKESSVDASLPSCRSPLNENMQDVVKKIKDALIRYNKKGKAIRAQEADAAALIAVVLKGRYAFSVSGLCWHQFDGSCWRKCRAWDFDSILAELIYAGCSFLSFSSSYSLSTLKQFQLGKLSEAAAGNGVASGRFSGLFVSRKTISDRSEENSVCLQGNSPARAIVRQHPVQEWTAAPQDQGTAAGQSGERA
jgi:hypothetical protein